MNPSEFHASRKFAETRFGRIAYVERGAGPVALFLHGLPLCGYEWREVIEDLAPVRRCVALDMMGLGYTEVAPGQGVAFGDQARMVAAFLDALKIDRVDLVGNDTGGGVSQILAATEPQRVRTLALTNCEVSDLWPNALLAGFYQGVQAGVVPQGMKQMLGDIALARAQLAALVYEDSEMFTREVVACSRSSSARIASSRAPVPRPTVRDTSGKRPASSSGRESPPHPEFASTWKTSSWPTIARSSTGGYTAARAMPIPCAAST